MVRLFKKQPPLKAGQSFYHHNSFGFYVSNKLNKPAVCIWLVTGNITIKKLTIQKITNKIWK